MRKHIIGSIFKKEMIDILRDKKTLFMMIILPILMYPVLMILGSQVMMMSMNSMQQKELLIPFILIIGVLMGAMYPAINVMAGEKERGTLETLLTLPISNLELIMGKYMAVAASAIVTALLNIVSIALTMGFLVVGVIGTEELGMGTINIGELILPLIITLICICLFAMVIATISMCVCSLAKNFKEAQNYMMPIVFVVMIPSYASMIPNVELNAFTAMIPIVNMSLLIKSVLMFRYDIATIAIVLVTNVVFMLLSGFLLTKMFNSEDILFGSGKGFSFLKKRTNIKKGTLPTLSDGIALCAVTLLLLDYFRNLLQIKLWLMGVAVTQLIILTMPLVFSYYITTDFKKVFAIKLPRIKHLLGGVTLWAGSFIISMIAFQLILHLFPQNMKVAKAFAYSVIGVNNVFVALIVTAVLPAICEEVFYRGFLVTAFKNKNSNSNRRAIILSGILFGLMHIDFIRIVPTVILGLSLSYVVCKTGSLFIPILMHFLSNAFATLTGYYPKSILGDVNRSIRLDFRNIDLMKLGSLIGISMLLVLLAVFLLKEREVKKVSTIGENA